MRHSRAALTYPTTQLLSHYTHAVQQLRLLPVLPDRRDGGDLAAEARARARRGAAGGGGLLLRVVELAGPRAGGADDVCGLHGGPAAGAERSGPRRVRSEKPAASTRATP